MSYGRVLFERELQHNSGRVAKNKFHPRPNHHLMRVAHAVGDESIYWDGPTIRPTGYRYQWVGLYGEWGIRLNAFPGKLFNVPAAAL